MKVSVLSPGCQPLKVASKRARGGRRLGINHNGSVSVPKGVLVYPYYVRDNTLTPLWLHRHGGCYRNQKGVSVSVPLIYTSKNEDHISHVLQVLRHLHKRILQVAINKFKFNTTKVKYLGMIVITDGIEIDTKNVDAIQK